MKTDKAREKIMIYVGITKDTGALGFTQDLEKANNNFELPFNSYLHWADHIAAVEQLEQKVKQVEEISSLIESIIAGLTQKLTAAEAKLAAQEMKLNWCKSQRNLYLEGLAEKLSLPDTELREKIKKCDQELEQLTKENR